uniref:RAP domain-containing protein n=1 Tax=Theileria annulata TaxID=5874 RepID=A0A3B0N8S9_THEAN
MARVSTFDLYKNVRKVLNTSGSNLTDFCNVISKLTRDKSKRFVLNSVDSIFEGIKIPEILEPKSPNESISVARSLIKVPKALFLPRNLDEDSRCQNLPKLLESSLTQITDPRGKLSEINSFFTELRSTTQFLTDNSLQDNYGPLRPFVIDFLRKHEEELLGYEELGDMKKLRFCLTLMDVLKTHSMDSQKLHQKIIEIVEKTPSIVKQVPFETLTILSKLKLPQNSKKYFKEHLQSMVFEDLPTIIMYSRMVFTQFDDKSVLEAFLCSLKHKLKSEKCEGDQLFLLLRNLKLLKNRHADEDLNSLTESLLELVYPKVSQMLHDSKNKVDSENVLAVFDCYMSVCRNSSNIFLKNCVDGLINYVLENRGIFTPVQLITVLSHFHTGSNGTKILVKGEYLEMNDLNDELTKYFLRELSLLEFNDFCELLYSIPLNDYFKLYHIMSSFPLGSSNPLTPEEEVLRVKVKEIVKRRIIHNLDNNNNSQLYNKQISNIMLYKDNDINAFFESNIENITETLSVNQLIQIINNHNHNNLNQKVLNGVLSCLEKKMIGIGKLDVLTKLVERNKLIKTNSNLTNKLFSILVYKLINSKNGYVQLLQTLAYLSNEVDSTLINIVVQYYKRYLVHLSVYDIELLLLCINKYNVVDNDLLSLLNHVYDINISNIPNQVLINILQNLKNLKVRHDPLVKKFTDKLLNNFKSSNYVIHDLISLIDILSALSIPYNDLYIYLLNYLSAVVSGGSETKPNHFNSLKVRDKVDLLHSIANFGIVDQNLKKLYLSVIDQLYPETDGDEAKDCEGGSLTSKTKPDEPKDNNMLLKLYEIHIDLVLNNIYNDEVEFLGKKLEQASKAWFTRQELKAHNFQKSNTYITVKEALEKLDVKFDSGVTEIYFCNFVIKEKGTVIQVIPVEDELRFWTTNLDSRNLVENSKVFMGNSQKVIKNLKLSGYQVIELSQSKWDSMDQERTEYLQNLLK